TDRLPQRPTADAKSLGKLGLVQLGAGRQRTRHNLLKDRAVYPLHLDAATSKRTRIIRRLWAEVGHRNWPRRFIPSRTIHVEMSTHLLPHRTKATTYDHYLNMC